MINTLYLPELREMLSAGQQDGLREFCTALHPARTAEFMEGLTADEAWAVLRHADPQLREEVFAFFDEERQREILVSQERGEVAELVAQLAADDRVDLLHRIDPAIVGEILPLLPADDRREVLRLRAYSEGTAGAVMTTEAAKLSEDLTVAQAFDELSHQAMELETIYYLYIVDSTDHLRGLVSARQLVSAIARPETKLYELMTSDLISADVMEDQESVAAKVARYDLLAIPVVDHEHRMLGIITHDDVIDVFVEEAVEDAHRIAAVEPLEDSYLKTPLLTLSRKRGTWLTILFIAALLTALALKHYDQDLERFSWLAWFLPLIISSGGNTGSQAATLVITAMATGDLNLRDWVTVVRRELFMGTVLGIFLATIAFCAALLMAPTPFAAAVIPVTVMLVVQCGTLCGAILPLIFQRLGWDPALMSSPFVAGIIDIVGIVVYMNVAIAVLGTPA
jgi:magnesium transporter